MLWDGMGPSHIVPCLVNRLEDGQEKISHGFGVGFLWTRYWYSGVGCSHGVTA